MPVCRGKPSTPTFRIGCCSSWRWRITKDLNSMRPGLTATVYEAATGRDALTATVDFHMAYTMRILGPYRGTGDRTSQRPSSGSSVRRARDRQAANSAARHDATQSRGATRRLLVEIEAATDLMAALLSASLSSELVEQRNWTLNELRQRLLRTLRRTLLVDEHDQLEGPHHAQQPD